ncbi:hypothetical protein FD754_012432 [Muntiacus muntjak]|uniref:60S ribosomal protein L9 n=1 Tax=Muntiacus muntjak TaxID=9888 RepID=A0A5N3VGQ7_MUNMU|nr:hypothetical protein FD754_012432 [Muntiacus muntjak]
MIVKGSRATLRRVFNHFNRLRDDEWWGDRKDLAITGIICSHTQNKIKGVSLGFHYKIRSLYTHFPIYAITQKTCSLVWMWPDIACSVSQAQGDELILEGGGSRGTSNSAASIQRPPTVKKPGYQTYLWMASIVSERGTVLQTDE